jgi:putative ABC transport system permease protein
LRIADWGTEARFSVRWFFNPQFKMEGLMENLLNDLRYGARMLLGNPGPSAIAVLALALGIGANTAIFSVVNAVLLKPLPYADAHRLVTVWGNLNREGLTKMTASVPEFNDYLERNQLFEHLAAYDWQSFNLTGDGNPERVIAARVTTSFFPVMGVTPALGRTFLDEEDRAGRDQVVIISHGLWQSRFAADPNIVGRTLTLNGRGYTVVGVMPAGFEFPFRFMKVWKPMAFTAEERSESERGSHFLNVIGRLKSDVTTQRAQSEMAAVGREIGSLHEGDYPSGYGVQVISLHEQTVGPARDALMILFVMVGFVLLIACANVANLLLVRATSRQKEIAIRLALGASRSRVMRQLLAESLLLAVVGGVAGLLLALWGVDLLIALGPDDLPRLKEVAVDGRALGFTFALSMLVGALCGLAPALGASKPDLTVSLKEGGKGAGADSRHGRLRSLLVVSEVTLALVLLVGAGLVIKSFIRLQQVDPGFSAEGVLSLRVLLPQEKYAEPARKRNFFTELTERVGALPGVEAVGAVTYLPLSGSINDRSFSIEGRSGMSGQSGDTLPGADYIGISDNYFDVMRTPMIRGRSFVGADSRESAAAIINETMARRFWSDENPLGQRIRLGSQESPFPWMTIVGVVKDIHHSGLDAKVNPTIFVPYLQPRLPAFAVGSMFLVARTSGDPKSLIAPVRTEVLGIDKDQPITNVDTMQQRLAESTAERRFHMFLFGTFAVVALVLAAIGIYGVMSYTVTQRTREIGIRMAVGAAPRDVLRLVIGQGMLMVLVGVALGLIGALGLTRLMSSLLFDVSATDAATFIVIALALMGTALLACYLPARRAMKVDPGVALRYE